ncbi:hypothetical protein CLF_108092 [Clonorchis sinensis]|uniref:Uncharacterized protein n=1 Tax=Clonorchis sinensis TaxID=79923 RepID=G7YRA2_CLOSI|nr:hypothetical protein CLF_108092 [Clonorchis sinensis]
MSIEFNQLRELLQQQQKQFEEAQLKLIESLTQRLHIQTAAASTGESSVSSIDAAAASISTTLDRQDPQASEATAVGCCFSQKAYPTQDWPGIRDPCRSGIKPTSDWLKIWTQQPIMTQYWPIAGCQWCIQNASEFQKIITVYAIYKKRCTNALDFVWGVNIPGTPLVVVLARTLAWEAQTEN